MTNSSSSFMAIVFGLAVFAVIVAVGWRSVQNRRILRLRGADGQETIIVAGEGDEISSVVTTTETVQPAPEGSPKVPATQAEADAAGRDRLSRMVATSKL
jgi:hypothetical protein